MKRPLIIGLLIVALTLVCAGIGAVFFFANGLNVNNPFDKIQLSSTLEESKTLKVDAGKPVTLNIADDAGAITVTGADVDTVQVKVIKTAYESTQTRADAEVKTIKYTVQQDGNNITLKYELPKSVNISNRINSVDFIVTVPTQTTLDVDTSSGEVNISNLVGNVSAENDFGEMTVDNIEGALSLQTTSGDVNAMSIKAGTGNIYLKTDFGGLTLEKADGKDITLDTNSGAPTLTDIRATGRLSISTEFGSVTLEKGSANSLTVDSNNGNISLTKFSVKGEIHIETDFGAIELEQVQANSYNLSTNGGDISIDGAKGKLTANTDFGNIEIENGVLVVLNLETNSGTVSYDGSLGEGEHIVKSDFGAVDLTLPADVKLNVDLSTDFGNIKSDLPISITVTENSNTPNNKIVGSINGGGDLLTVDTNNGNVNIHAK